MMKRGNLVQQDKEIVTVTITNCIFHLILQNSTCHLPNVKVCAIASSYLSE